MRSPGHNVLGQVLAWADGRRVLDVHRACGGRLRLTGQRKATTGSTLIPSTLIAPGSGCRVLPLGAHHSLQGQRPAEDVIMAHMALSHPNLTFHDSPHSALAMLTYFLCLAFAKHGHASGPLHLALPPPGMWFSQLCPWLFLSPPWGLGKDPFSETAASNTQPLYRQPVCLVHCSSLPASGTWQGHGSQMRDCLGG